MGISWGYYRVAMFVGHPITEQMFVFGQIRSPPLALLRGFKRMIAFLLGWRTMICGCLFMKKFAKVDPTAYGFDG